jgi:hypothetical protein
MQDHINGAADMIVVSTIQERDRVPGSVLNVSNGDGTWTVYQEGDEIPSQHQWIFAGAQ